MPLSSLLLCLLLLEYKNMGLVEHKQTLAGQCLWYDHFYVFNTSFRDCVCCVFEIYVTSAEPDGNVLEVWVTQHTNHSSKYLLENQLSFFFWEEKRMENFLYFVVFSALFVSMMVECAFDACLMIFAREINEKESECICASADQRRANDKWNENSKIY